jgi:amino acid adenylation domain-containing protein
VRARLLRLSDDEHVLLFTLHHIVSDGWSLGILVREIAALYEAFAAGRPSPLPALPIQYADYAAWQRRYLDGEVLARQLVYWKKTLAGAPEALDLPTDRPRPPMQSFRGAQVRVSFPGTLARALSALARKEGATLYMTLLAAFQVLLARSTGQDDIVVGTPVANRTRTETEGLIGFLINTLVIRTALGEAPTFRDVLARVREAALGAYAHQDVPFERLVEELRPQRDLSRSPLFQVMFALQNTPLAPVRVTGLSLSGIQADSASAKFDLTLTLEEGEDGLSGYFEYVTDLFDASTIERMAAHYRTLLEGIVASPTLPIGELPMLPKAEQRTVLVDWNPTELFYAREARLFDAFRENAARLADKPAVVFQDTTLSYAELEARSNRLARFLAARGVRPGVLVGLFVERSAAMVVALLAILKAGGAYVPLDPAYPKGRLELILRDAGAPVLVTESALAGELDPGDAKVVSLDSDAAAIALEDAAPFDGGATADSVAYAIYTSGSTGTPKGVLVHHRALVNFMGSMAREPGLVETDRLLAVTSLSFDIAGLELYLPLTVGATVDVADRETSADGARLAARLRSTSATLLQATPATFRLLLDAGWEGDTNLVILCGGEAFPRPLADALVPRAKAVWNMFGPTETTIWSTVQRVSAGGAASVPIGKPIANTQLYVVDRGLRPVPIGVPGELLIGGDGVAKGYYRRDELSAERFIAHPLAALVRSLEPSAVLSEKVYRTGDLVRFLADGTVEFLGRLDHQVKLRGYRIELGEIEAVLGEHPAVREVVVVAREDASFDKRLVAYVALVEGASVTVADARAHLRERLPDYMLPSHFVVLPALPRTPNGKLDRKALPAPEGGLRRREAVAPRNAAERLALRLFAQVLRSEELGVTDDFFEVGGHSLLAAQLVARLTDAFRIELPVRVLFEAGTVEGVIRALNRLWGDAETVEAIAETTLSVDALSDEELAKMAAAESAE